VNRILTLLAAGVCAAALGSAAQAQVMTTTPTAKATSLTRIECGTPQPPVAVNQRFSDTYAYGDKKVQFVYSCYLIKHGDDYLLWDTGFAPGTPNTGPKESIPDQLAKLNVKPEQIKFVGISHYHGDHTGQLPSFTKATLLIGKNEWEGITAAKPNEGANVKAFESWIKGDNKVEPQSMDKDVFGDGSVVILRTPGHTPGHQALLVRLAKSGNYILSGDAVHFQENWETGGVPAFNYDRGQSVASMDRMKKIAQIHKAKLIIQHDQRDIAKLPAFPAGAM
jgi:glyoxylase-like metal-dependent hydrolase (beta-lactamase superfamily II)